MISLTADERSIRAASDDQVETWLSGAKRGDSVSKEKLCCWAYLTAAEYYQGRVQTEKNLSMQDAEDLTAEFFADFEQALPRMESATHFSRHLMMRKLGRYLQSERRRYSRSPGFESSGGEEPVEEVPHRPWEHWSDLEWSQYRATLIVLSELDTVSRRIVDLRARNAAYEHIAEETGLSEAAVRMRMARFYKAVRSRFEEISGGRVT